MKKYISEIFLTTDFVTDEEWLKFIMEISRLNGLLKSWKIYLKIERNIIKYYIITKRKIPTILSCSGNFLIKNIEKLEKVKAKIPFLYLVTNKEKNIIDIYDKNEAKYNQNLRQIEIKIRSFKKDNYFTKTKLIFENSKGKKSKAIALFFIPHTSISIDFTKHRKEGSKYLKIDKSIGLFGKQKRDDNLLEINTFPYSQEKYYLNISDYDYEKHSLIVGASGTGKSKLIATFIKNIYDNEFLRKRNKIIGIK